jgi:hypothetical protein
MQPNGKALDLGDLEAERDKAWLAYNQVARAIPDCPHVVAWREQIAAARERYRAVLRAADAAATTSPEPFPAPSSLLPEPEPADDGALFPLEAA